MTVWAKKLLITFLIGSSGGVAAGGYVLHNSNALKSVASKTQAEPSLSEDSHNQQNGTQLQNGTSGISSSDSASSSPSTPKDIESNDSSSTSSAPAGKPETGLDGKGSNDQVKS